MDLQKLHHLFLKCVGKNEGGTNENIVQIRDNVSVLIIADKARENKKELIELLKEYNGPKPLSDGPSYIEVGAVVGSQRNAFILFAIGKVLGFWDIITPETSGIIGKEADELAGIGMISISGYNPT